MTVLGILVMEWKQHYLKKRLKASTEKKKKTLVPIPTFLKIRTNVITEEP